MRWIRRAQRMYLVQDLAQGVRFRADRVERSIEGVSVVKEAFDHRTQGKGVGFVLLLYCGFLRLLEAWLARH